MYHDFPSRYYQLLEGEEDAVLLETSRYDSDNFRTLLFLDPVDTLEIFSVDEVPALMAAIEEYLKQNYYLAGFFGYECGYYFEEISDTSTLNEPIASFGVFHAPIVFDHRRGEFENLPPDTLKSLAPDRSACGEYKLSEMRLDISKQEYSEKVNRIKEYILSGDTYQINFTTRYSFQFDGFPLALFQQLKRKQPVSYGAFLKSNGRHILSLSPELFFRYRDGKILAEPMKGTARRGNTCAEDLHWESWLREDEKNRAENLMIVDLLRNDLGRICQIGSIKVRELFSVEKYQTLFQMTSAIEGVVKEGVTYYDILRSLFPCGSVTGAPKIRSMQIIDELEADHRGIYTGAIGYFSPANEAVFNVAIRTIVIQGRRGEMGVGSGIVFDSVPEEEYAECELKAQFLTSPYEEFELLETMLWDNGFPFLEKHMRRLSQSARYFDFACDTDSFVRKLQEISNSFENGRKYKVRLKLNRSGEAFVEHLLLEDQTSDSLVVGLSSVRTNSDDRFLYHKTTNRHPYAEQYRRTTEKGFADIIFMNEKDEITEGAVNNVVLRKRGCLITPPISCGLLNGIYRQYLLETQPNLIERTVSITDLQEAEAVYICNAVRGMRQVKLCVEYAALSQRLDTTVDMPIFTK